MALAPRGFSLDDEYKFAVGRYNDGTESPTKMQRARGAEEPPRLDPREPVDQAQFEINVYQHSGGGRFCYRSDAILKRTARQLEQFNEKEGVKYPLRVADGRVQLARLLRLDGRRARAQEQVKLARETRMKLLHADAEPAQETSELLGYRFREHEAQRERCAHGSAAVQRLVSSAGAVASALHTGPLDPAAVEPLRTHAAALCKVGDYVEASPLLFDAMHRCERAQGAAHKSTVEAMVQCVAALEGEVTQGMPDADPERVENLLRRALKLVRFVGHPAHGPVVVALKRFRTCWLRRASETMRAERRPLGPLVHKMSRAFDQELFRKANLFGCVHSLDSK